MAIWSEDALDNFPVHLSQYPESMLDYLGMSTPSPEDIQISIETLKELIMTAKSKKLLFNEDIAAAAELAGLAMEAPEPTTSEYGDVVLELPGVMMTLLIHDEALKLDDFGLPGLIQALADKAQYMRINNRIIINDITSQAQDNRDPMTNAHSRISIESEGDTAHEPDGELPGLTSRQRTLMVKLEDQVYQADILLNDLESWYQVVALEPSKRPLLRRKDSEVERTIYNSRDKRAKEELAEREQRQFRAQVQLDRLRRMRGGADDSQA